MKTGLPRLNRPLNELVTACSGIAPLGRTPARALRILKYCLSPVSGASTRFLVVDGERNRVATLQEKGSKTGSGHRTHLQGILQHRSDAGKVSAVKDEIEAETASDTSR